MNDIFIYIIDLPTEISEMVTPCDGGFTIYLNGRLSYTDRVRAYCHALRHIENEDWSKEDVQQIEYEAHKEET